MPGGNEAFNQLPPRLTAVLAMVAGGRTNRDISEELCVTIHTAEKYVSEILARAHCRTRAELISTYWQEILAEH